MFGRKQSLVLSFVLCTFVCRLASSQSPRGEGVTFKNISVEWCNASYLYWWRSCVQTTIVHSDTLVECIPPGTDNSTYTEFSVNISHQNVPVLRKNSVSDIHLGSFELNNCGLAAIKEGAFEHSTIGYLSLNNNNLEKLEKGIFKTASIKWVLNLGNNSIKVIDEGTFEQLNLEILDLSSNRLDEITSGVFTNISVSYINLSRNHIKIIRKEVFQNVRGLEVLDLSHNEIHLIEAGSLVNLVKYTTLYLNNNSLENIPQSIYNSKVFDRLLLNENNIQAISPGAFQNSSFRYLDLADNKLEEIRNDTFGTNSRIRYLILSRNKIKDIEPGALDAVYGGVKLDFNDLQTIRNGTFKDALVVVLSYNKSLRKIEPGAFGGNITRANFYTSSKPKIYLEQYYLDEESKYYIGNLTQSGKFYLVEWADTNNILLPFT